MPRKVTRIAAALCLALLLPQADAGPRSKAVRADFMRTHPCPANGATRGACPGHVVDHIIPLCGGGADAVANMQWQTAAAAKVKDRDEARQCRARK